MEQVEVNMEQVEVNTVWTLLDPTQTGGIVKSEPQTTKPWENQQAHPQGRTGVPDDLGYLAEG
jgi:hypothetical protein